MLLSDRLNEAYRTDLEKPIQRELKRLSSKQQEKYAELVHLVFDSWKNDHGELRSVQLPILADVPPTLDEAKPYECAGFGVKNYTDLAFKLWVESYEPFTKLLNTIGILKGLAVIYDKIDSLKHFDSLIRLSCFISDITYEVQDNISRELFDKYKQSDRDKSKILKGLNDEGRIKGAIANRQRSEERKVAWRSIAVDQFKANPHMSYDQVVSYILGTSAAIKKNGKKYSERTILDAISGTKMESRYF